MACRFIFELVGLFLRLLYILYGVFWPFSGFLFCENDV